MIIPPYLSTGSTIGITCPAGFVSSERVAHCVKVLNNWGFKVKLGETVGSEHFYFSGNDAARLRDLQAMLDDPTLDAILMGRGGYGLSRIIDQLNFDKLTKKPKWVCGFSDITVLHQHLNQRLKMASLHAPMCSAFTPDMQNSAHLLSFKHALMGQRSLFSFPVHLFNRPGIAKGKLVGGNLAIMAHLTGSVSQVKTKNCLLFLEDVGEYLYNLDRMLYNLKRAGLFDNLAGVILGGFTDLQDTERPFGKTGEEILKDIFQDYSYPVAFQMPCGHLDINYPLKLGVSYQLVVNNELSILKEKKTI